MRAETELQYMMDFYPDMFPTRKHCLNYLFCTIGNGYKWLKGELVDKDDTYSKRYALVEDIEHAEPRDYEQYEKLLELEEMKKKILGDAYVVTADNAKFNFVWDKPSKNYSHLYNYPKNIKKDWKALLDECRQMLVEDGILTDED